jgi:hypothetical protein
MKYFVFTYVRYDRGLNTSLVKLAKARSSVCIHKYCVMWSYNLVCLSEITEDEHEFYRAELDSVTL